MNFEIPKFEIIEGLYSQYWIDEWYDSQNTKELYRENGLKMLRTFFLTLWNNDLWSNILSKIFE